MYRQDFIFGIHAVEALLAQPTVGVVLSVYIKNKHRSPRIEAIIALAKSKNIDCTFLDIEKLDKIAPRSTHQGIIVQVSTAEPLDDHVLPSMLDNITGIPLLLILDNVQDPRNLGACLRNADAYGVNIVIIPQHNSASVNATVAKVACGAAATVQVVNVKNLARTMEYLKQRNIWIFGLSSDGSQPIYAENFLLPLALVLGSEGSGMRRLTRNNCDVLLHIPMQGTVASLNVSVAAGICLYEVMRQRK